MTLVPLHSNTKRMSYITRDAVNNPEGLKFIAVRGRRSLIHPEKQGHAIEDDSCTSEDSDEEQEDFYREE